MPNDPKWRTIAKASKRPIPEVLSVYVHLLVIASNATERGRTQSVCSEDIASALDMECEQIEAIMQAMQGRVLEGDKLAGWENRQANREDGSAERAKAWREAKKSKELTESNATERNRTQAERNQTPDKIRIDKNSPSLRSGEAGEPAARKRREETILKTYLETCKADGVKPIPADHPIRSYCADAHITDEMLQLAWIVFKDRFTVGKDKAKRQKDWPAHFANAVRGRWANLWHTTEKGETCWTSAGLQERAVAEARMKPHPGDTA